MSNYFAYVAIFNIVFKWILMIEEEARTLQPEGSGLSAYDSTFTQAVLTTE